MQLDEAAAAPPARAWLHWGVELRLWVAASVTSLSLFCDLSLRDVEISTGGLCGLALDPAHLFVFFATLALYNLDGTLDTPHSAPVRRRAHLSLTLFSILLLVLLLPRLGAGALWLALTGFVVCATYALPMRWGQKVWKLKQLPGIKAPFVGFSVATAVVWLAPLSRGAQFTPRAEAPAFSAEAGPLWLVLGILCAVNAMLFDVPDWQSDERQGVPTPIRKLGLGRTKALCVALSALALVMSWQQKLPALGLSLLCSALALCSLKITKKTKKSSVAWWVDGALFLPLLTLVFSA